MSSNQARAPSTAAPTAATGPATPRNCPRVVLTSVFEPQVSQTRYSFHNFRAVHSQGGFGQALRILAVHNVSFTAFRAVVSGTSLSEVERRIV